MEASSCEKLFDKINKKTDIYESVVLVESGSGDFSFSKGYRGKEVNTPIVAASITKMFTAACILKLMEQGIISLDDKISKFYEVSDIEGLHTYKKKDFTGEITLSDLLFQTSGLADFYEEGKNCIKKQIIKKDIFLSFKQKLDLTKELPAHFAPHSKKRAHYADINYDLLGDIIEKVTNKPLTEVFRTFIFTPLEMAHTYLPTSKEEYIPEIYVKNQKIHRPQFVICSGASGGVISTTRDLMIFMKAYFSGKFIDKKRLEQMGENRKLQLTMTPIRYAGGYMQISVEQMAILGKGMGSLIGHSGSTGSFAFYLPSKDLYFSGDFNQVANPVLPIRFVMQMAMRASK